MIIEIRTQLLELVKGKNGEQALDALLSSDLVALHRARDLAIRADFFALYGKTSRTARDIEEELAVKYDVALTTVKEARRLRG